MLLGDRPPEADRIAELLGAEQEPAPCPAGDRAGQTHRAQPRPASRLPDPPRGRPRLFTVTARGTGRSRPSRSTYDVVTVVGEAGDLPADGDPPAARGGAAVDDYCAFISQRFGSTPVLACRARKAHPGLTAQFAQSGLLTCRGEFSVLVVSTAGRGQSTRTVVSELARAWWVFRPTTHHGRSAAGATTHHDPHRGRRVVPAESAVRCADGR